MALKLKDFPNVFGSPEIGSIPVGSLSYALGENCGENDVYGLEELLIMGEVEFTDE